jgi:hypothetical protein
MAAFINQSQPFGPDTPNFEQVLTFDKFDPALGDLISVQVIYDLTTQGGSLTVDNDGLESATVTVQLGSAGDLKSTDVALLNAAFQPVLGDGVEAFESSTFVLGANIGDTPGDVDPSDPDGATLFGSSDTEMGSGFIASTLFVQYIGTDTFDVTAEVDQILNFGGVGGVEGSFTNMEAFGEVEVIYEYLPIPVPSALLLFASGLIGLVGLRRKFRR